MKNSDEEKEKKMKNRFKKQTEISSVVILVAFFITPNINFFQERNWCLNEGSQFLTTFDSPFL